MLSLKDCRDAFVHLIFPHLCAGCSTDVLPADAFLCINCLTNLPETGFHRIQDNPAEKTFWGRIPVAAASAQYYFNSKTLMQKLLHEFKYRQHKDLGFYLGKLMGQALSESDRFHAVDFLVPLPLHPKKQRLRGFNQAEVLCSGIAAVLNKPVLNNAVRRTGVSESQTRKNRIERWHNMQGLFQRNGGKDLKGNHILLVDDVLTTGATLEACSRELLQGGCTISIACLCITE